MTKKMTKEEIVAKKMTKVGEAVKCDEKVWVAKSEDGREDA